MSGYLLPALFSKKSPINKSCPVGSEAMPKPVFVEVNAQFEMGSEPMIRQQQVNCGRPPQVAFATHSFADQPAFGVGSRVEYTCDAGYTRVGPSLLECVTGGQWQPDAPACIADGE